MTDEPPSPCTKICLLDDATGWCLGCGRDIGEIAEWGAASAERRNEILRALPARIERLEAKNRS